MKITLQDALELLDKAHNFSPKTEGEHFYSIKTLYNGITEGKIKNYGRGNKALVDPKEVLAAYPPKHKRVA